MQNRNEESSTTIDKFELNEPKVIPPCPPWCRNRELFTAGRLADHGYDSVMTDERTYTRFHVSGQGDVYIAQEEFNCGGVVTLGPAFLTTHENNGTQETNAADARRMSAELLVGADDLDRINGRVA